MFACVARSLAGDREWGYMERILPPSLIPRRHPSQAINLSYFVSFSYAIKIENCCPVRVQLSSRQCSVSICSLILGCSDVTRCYSILPHLVYLGGNLAITFQTRYIRQAEKGVRSKLRTVRESDQSICSKKKNALKQPSVFFSQCR